MSMNELWIGWRLLTGRRSGLRQAGLIAFGVAIASSFLFSMASIPGAVVDRQTRDSHREWLTSGEPGGRDSEGMMAIGRDRFGEEVITHLLITPGSDAALAGIDPSPKLGDVLVSPAFAKVLESDASLIERLRGEVTGLLPNSFLLEPSELISISVVENEEILATGDARDLPNAPPPSPDVTISSDVLFVTSVALLVLALPLVLFITAATSFGLERRRERIQVLSLAGAERRQIGLFILLETVSAAVVGLIGGLGLFLLARPLLASLRVGSRSSFSSALEPPLVLVGAVVAFVVATAVIVSLAGSRRLERAPTEAITNRVQSIPGLVTMGLGIACLAVGVGSPTQTDAPHPLALAGMVLTAIGFALNGKALTASIGRWLGSRTSDAATLLAARRMNRSPAEVVRPLTAVVTGVLVVTAFFTITGTLLRSSNPRYDDLDDTQVVIEASQETLDTIANEIRGRSGVEAEVVEALVAVESPVWDSPRLGVVAECEALTRVVDVTTGGCSEGVVIAVSESVAAGSTLTVGSSPPLFDQDAEANLVFNGSTFQGNFPAVAIIDPALLDDDFLSALTIAQLLVKFDPDQGELEDLRTAVVSAVPTAHVRSVAEIEFDQSASAREVRTLGLVGLALVLTIAAFSLTVGTASHLLHNRNAYTFLRAGGLLPGQIGKLIALQSTVPLAVSAALGGVLGVGVGAAVALSAGSDPSVPWASVGLIYLVSVLLGVLVWVGFVPTLERLTSPTGLRFE